MRARAALDESDLERLKAWAKFYGLDKSKDFDDFKKKYLKASDRLGKIAMDLQLFARKSEDFDTIRLPKKEYGHVMNELNTHLSEEDREKPIVTKAIGNYVYTVENRGFNDYRIIRKTPIDDYY